MNAALSAAQAAPSSTIAAPLRTWRHMLSTRLARLSGKEVGEACECDHTTASRIVSGQRGATIGQFCDLLDLCNLKIVSAEKRCVSPERLRFLETTTARALLSEVASKALWEDPE